MEVPQIVASAGQHLGEAANSALGYIIALIRLARCRNRTGRSRSGPMLPSFAVLFTSTANDNDRFYKFGGTEEGAV